MPFPVSGSQGKIKCWSAQWSQQWHWGKAVDFVTLNSPLVQMSQGWEVCLVYPACLSSAWSWHLCSFRVQGTFSPCKLSLHLPYHQSTHWSCHDKKSAGKKFLCLRNAPELTFTPALKSSNVSLCSFIVPMQYWAQFWAHAHTCQMPETGRELQICIQSGKEIFLLWHSAPLDVFYSQ